MNEYIASSASLTTPAARSSAARPAAGAEPAAAPGSTAATPAPGTAAAASAAPVPFHLLGRAHGSHRWWRPLLTLLATGATYLVLLVLVTVGFGIAALLPGGTPIIETFTAGETDMGAPIVQLYTLLTLIVLIPACLIGVRLGGGRPVGTLLSVTGRMRWGLLGRSMILSLVLIVASMLVSSLLGLGEPIPHPVIDERTLVALLIALLFVPFQAAAEELAFRGVLPQVIGGWLRHPAWAYLAPVPFFVIAHDYNWIGLIDITVFAVAMGVLTHRSGGLELAIGLHVVNNTLIFVLAAFGLVDMNVTEIQAIGVAVTVATTVLFTAIALWRLPRWDRTGRTNLPGGSAQSGSATQPASATQPGTPVPAITDPTTGAEAPATSSQPLSRR